MGAGSAGALARRRRQHHGGRRALQPGGWALAISMLAAIRWRLRYSDPPEGLRGLGLTFIVVGLMSLGFMGFAGVRLG